ncbi:hypothetical protein NE661_11840, partial [Megasphaera massiliensis]|nr:hypothetical protein [Megasphaera massiliensis]
VGDPNQIDRPFLDERTNGHTYAAGKMKGSPLCYQLTMRADECERSPLALDAVQLLLSLLTLTVSDTAWRSPDSTSSSHPFPFQSANAGGRRDT